MIEIELHPEVGEDNKPRKATVEERAWVVNISTLSAQGGSPGLITGIPVGYNKKGELMVRMFSGGNLGSTYRLGAHRVITSIESAELAA